MYVAMLAYCPGRYEGRILVLRAKIPILTRRNDEAMGWQAVTAGRVTVYSIPGGHDDCVSEKHGAELAFVLQQCAADFECVETAAE